MMSKCGNGLDGLAGGAGEGGAMVLPRMLVLFFPLAMKMLYMAKIYFDGGMYHIPVVLLYVLTCLLYK